MEYQKAYNIATEIVDKLRPVCSRIEIAGSIRRKRPYVNDIDIVLILANQGAFLNAIRDLGVIKSGAGKLIRLDMKNGVGVDFYIATPETWATLLLIRTGSKDHNIKLCVQARRQGMILHADGRGLVRPKVEEPRPKDDEPVKCDTEEDIFKALGLPYKKPEERN